MEARSWKLHIVILNTFGKDDEVDDIDVVDSKLETTSPYLIE